MGYLISQRGKQLTVTDIWRQVCNLDAAFGFDEGVQIMTSGMTLDPNPILSLEHVVLHIQLVLMMLLLVLFTFLVHTMP